MYIVRHERRNERLRYSLRSVKNIPHQRVWIVGHKPSWAINVEHRQTHPDGRHKYDRVTQNVLAACHAPGISDPFIIMNDDFFILRPITELQNYWRETVEQGIDRYRRQNMTRWRKDAADALPLFRSWGVEDPFSWELHIPMIVHKEPMIEAIARFGQGTPIWRTLYGNYMDLTGARMVDVKHNLQTRPSRSDVFASCSDAGFNRGPIGKVIAKQFATPSVFERR